MPLTKFAIDKFISNKIYNVTECNVKNIRNEFRLSEKWVTGFAQMCIFGNSAGNVPSDYIRPFLFFLIRRIETAFSEYSLARDKLIEFTSKKTNWSAYFQALYHFELAISQLYQIYDHIRKMENKSNPDFKFFQSKDGSELDRLNRIYNISKHALAETDQPVWITNTGINAINSKDQEEIEITFCEIEELLHECGQFADKMYRPETILTLQSINQGSSC